MLLKIFASNIKCFDHIIIYLFKLQTKFELVPAGLLRGSTPGGSRNVVSQLCEKVDVRHVRSNRRSTPSAFFTFDPVMEREEEIDPAEVLRAIDAIEATAQHAAQNADAKPEDSAAFDDSEEWAKVSPIVRFTLPCGYIYILVYLLLFLFI